MIQEDYVSFELAKKLKEKGFPQEGPGYSHAYSYPIDEPTLHQSTNWQLACITERDNTEEAVVIAPTFFVAQKWLREEKRINIDIEVYCNCKFQMILRSLKDNVNDVVGDYTYTLYDTYEEALEAGINNALKLI